LAGGFEQKATKATKSLRSLCCLLFKSPGF
jgi:hypothetical protein